MLKVVYTVGFQQLGDVGTVKFESPYAQSIYKVRQNS